MEWHINDLSLNGQFENPQEFKSVLEPLLILRNRLPLLRELLYCSRLFRERQVTAIHDLRNAVRATGDKNFINVALAWADRQGPFWDDTRQFNYNDYFEYQGKDVTEQGLGEASRRKLTGTEAKTFSFPLEIFKTSPLTVQHGLREAPFSFIDIANQWTIDQLEADVLESCYSSDSWNDVKREIIRRFDQLIFSDNIIEKLISVPFSKGTSERIFDLLDILNQLVKSSNSRGELSEKGREILRNYFAGTCGQRTPRFKPESPSNQHTFREKLTFKDPCNVAETLFCHWHGKIQTPQLRIHFEWPRPNGQREIKVVYIGPKLTKD